MFSVLGSDIQARIHFFEMVIANLPMLLFLDCKFVKNNVYSKINFIFKCKVDMKYTGTSIFVKLLVVKNEYCYQFLSPIIVIIKQYQVKHLLSESSLPTFIVILFSLHSILF